MFVAVWPPEEVLARLRALDRPELPGLRWSTEDQWHVTLVFLGEVAEADVGPLGQAVRDAASGLDAGLTAELGPATRRLGRAVLCLPVAGLDEAAAAVRDRTAAVVADPDPRPFAGHLTLARARGVRPVPGPLVGRPCRAAWTVEALTLVRSETGPEGAAYESLVTAPLGR